MRGAVLGGGARRTEAAAAENSAIMDSPHPLTHLLSGFLQMSLLPEEDRMDSLETLELDN